MLVYVDHVYGSIVRDLVSNGWRVHLESGLENSALGRRQIRRINGLQMEKNFESMGEAMREFEAITGRDVISNTDWDGCPNNIFFCDEKQLAAGGWECGKYMFDKWLPTPRQTLDALNTLSKMVESE